MPAPSIERENNDKYTAVHNVTKYHYVAGQLLREEDDRSAEYVYIHAVYWRSPSNWCRWYFEHSEQSLAVVVAVCRQVIGRFPITGTTLRRWRRILQDFSSVASVN